MDKDFRIWIELASRKRKCRRCGDEIAKGVMLVRMGSKEKTKSSPCMCASCFETVMSDLSEEFQGMKQLNPPIKQEEKVEEPAHLELGPHCFACGLAPEKCRCAREAYR